MGGGDRRLGPKIRALRRERGWTQVELARRLEISPSYLNLIEREQRPVTASVLVRVARILEVELESFSPENDARLVADVIEAFADPEVGPHELGSSEADELVQASPELARALVRSFQACRGARERAARLADEIYEAHQQPALERRTPLDSEVVSDFIQARGNYFPELEEAAETSADAKARSEDLFARLREQLRCRHAVDVVLAGSGMGLRTFEPETGVLRLSERMSASGRVFQLAVQVALLEHAPLLESLTDVPALTSESARALGRIVLANYFAGAVMMPYARIHEAACRERYDVELLAHRFGASFEQVCHRLTSLRRPGAAGIPLHMIRVDLAGNISKRFSASGIDFARFAGACPRWNIFSAFMTPGVVRTQVSVMPDGGAYFCLARTVLKGRGYPSPRTVQAIGLGCALRYAAGMVYSDGVDTQSLRGAVPVGVTCRLCEREACEQRAFPSIRAGIALDPHRRGLSVFEPPRKGVT